MHVIAPKDIEAIVESAGISSSRLVELNTSIAAVEGEYTAVLRRYTKQVGCVADPFRTGIGYGPEYESNEAHLFVLKVLGVEVKDRRVIFQGGKVVRHVDRLELSSKPVQFRYEVLNGLKVTSAATRELSRTGLYVFPGNKATKKLLSFLGFRGEPAPDVEKLYDQMGWQNGIMETVVREVLFSRSRSPRILIDYRNTIVDK